MLLLTDAICLGKALSSIFIVFSHFISFCLIVDSISTPFFKRNYFVANGRDSSWVGDFSLFSVGSKNCPALGVVGSNTTNAGFFFFRFFLLVHFFLPLPRDFRIN